MARKKSINDLIDQSNRLVDKLRYDGTENATRDARLKRVGDAFSKYVDNIVGTKSYQHLTSSERRLKAIQDNYNKTGVWDEVNVDDKITEKANGRKYSQRIYMGLNQG